MKRKNIIIIVLVLIILAAIITPFVVIEAQYDKKTSKSNPAGFYYVGADANGRIVSNYFDNVDVRSYGIPWLSRFIYFDGFNLYFAKSTNSENYRSGVERITIYSFNPIEKTSKQILTYNASEMREIFESVNTIYLDCAYMISPEVFCFIGKSTPYGTSHLAKKPAGYMAIMNSSKKVISRGSFSKMDNFDKQVSTIVNDQATFKWNSTFEFDKETFSDISLSYGDTTVKVFDQNITDEVFNFLKTKKGVSCKNMRKFVPSDCGLAVSEIQRKVTFGPFDSCDYNYFVSTIEGETHFLFNNGEEQLTNVFAFK